MALEVIPPFGEARLRWLLQQPGGMQNPLFWNPQFFLPCLTVKNKQGQRVPFVPYTHQLRLAVAILKAWELGYTGLVHVKPRQEGATALFAAVLTWLTMFQKGQTSAILSYKGEHSKSAMEKCIGYWNSLPEWARPVRNKQIRSRLAFEAIESNLYLSSVRADEPYRGETVNWLLADEISSWAAVAGESAWVAARNAVPEQGGFIFALSTPKGYGDQLHQLWEEAEHPDARWLRVFISWLEIEEYSKEPPPNWHPNTDVTAYALKYRLTEAQAFWMQTVGLPKCQGNMERFLSEYPPNEDECWVQAGEHVFEPEVLRRHLDRLKEERGQAFSSPQETLDIFIAPETDHRYVVSVDPASGWAKTDYWGITCWDLYTGEEVWEFWGHARADEINELLKFISPKYNRPLIAIEANGVGDALLSYVTRERSLDVYWRDTTHPGWWSGEGSKAQAIADLQALLVDGTFRPNSPRLIRQLMQYRVGKARDDEKGHFDLAGSACMGAWFWKRQTRRKKEAPPQTHADLMAEYRRQNQLGAARPRPNTPWGNHR